jgi:hypothetical protein
MQWSRRIDLMRSRVPWLPLELALEVADYKPALLELADQSLK